MDDPRRHAFEPVSSGLRVTKRCRAGRAFTLVELLAVIAVLAILIMLLVPTLYRAIRFARLASCAANMHGVYTALMVYAGDNKNFVPTVGAFTRPWGGDSGPSTGRAGKSFFFATLLETRAFDNLQLMICPGTQMWGGSDLLTRSGLYKDTGANGKHNYVLRNASNMNEASMAWCNYSLRWSGWWHKVYPTARLMLAESTGYFSGPRLWEIEMHGDGFRGVAHNIGGSIAHIGEPTMNIVGSDGRVVRLLDYANLSAWKWDMGLGGFTIPANPEVENAVETTLKTDPNYVGVYGDPSLPYYYPANDRTGDLWVTGFRSGYSGIAWADPWYTDQTDSVLLAMSDGPWAFWVTFDRFLFNQTDVYPWGSSFWHLTPWQNP